MKITNIIAAGLALTLAACSIMPKQVSNLPSINSVVTISSEKGNWSQTTECRLPKVRGWSIGEIVCLVPKGDDVNRKEFFSEALQRLLANGWSAPESSRVKILIPPHSQTMLPHGLHFPNGGCRSRLLINLDHEQIRPTMVFVRYDNCETLI